MSAKKEIFFDELDEITGGANINKENTIERSQINGGNVQGNSNNQNRNGTMHIGEGITQVNQISNNKGTVNIDKNVNIGNAGTGNSFNL